MPMSNYPKGFSAGLCVQNLPILNTYAGNIFWVDSAAGSNGNKGTFAQPFASIEYAVGRCTASNGDIIICKPGHVETVSEAGGLDLDVAGITIVFLGNGDNRAKIQFTTVVGADMDVDAANITLINPRFVAGIDALTGPIDVNAADFTIINGEFHDATDICTTDCVIASSAATRLVIDGWKFFKGNEGGTQKESHFQCDGVDDLILRNIHVEGDFDTGIFETGTDECLRMTLENIFMKNTDAGNAPCFEMDSANSGWANDLNLRNVNGTAVSDVADINWSSSCLQYGTDGYGGEPIGGADSSSVEGQVAVIDGFHDVPTADGTDNAQMRDVVGNKEDAAVGAVGTDKSLMAYIKGLLEDTGTTIPAAITSHNAAVPKCVEKLDGSVEDGAADDLFVITGGPVRAKIVGVVTTVIGGASNMKLQIETDSPAATVDLNAAAVAIDADAVGTIYTNQGATSVFTPSSGLGHEILDPVTVEETEFILTPGTVKAHSSAAQTGVIAWYMSYTPLTPSASVAAAA